jgi:hypothetical protein
VADDEKGLQEGLEDDTTGVLRMWASVRDSLQKEEEAGGEGDGGGNTKRGGRGAEGGNKEGEDVWSQRVGIELRYPLTVFALQFSARKDSRVEVFTTSLYYTTKAPGAHVSRPRRPRVKMTQSNRRKHVNQTDENIFVA